MRLTIFALIAMLVQSCGEYKPGVTETSTSTTTTSTSTSSSAAFGSSSTPGVNAALYFNIQSAWETMTSDRSTLLSDCSVPLNSAVGTTATCTLSIPEGQLFYSELYMTVGSADTTQCKRVRFIPYGFLASNTAGYNLPKTGTLTTVDCSVSPTPATCYDGPATSLYSDYPSTGATYFTTNNAAQSEYTIPSANSQGKLYNTWTANAMTDWTLDDSIGTGARLSKYKYVDPAVDYANSLHDWQAECRDEYDELIYSITLYITSVPYLTPGISSFAGWD